MAVTLRYYIESASIPSTQAYPTFDGLFEDKPERDQVYFRRGIRNALTFKGADYTALIALESNICEEVTVTIDRNCHGAGWVEYWRGVFTLQDATIDKDNCFIRVKCTPDDQYRCILLAQKEEQNVFDLDVVPVRGYSGTYEVECNTGFSNPGEVCDDIPQPIVPGYPGEWCTDAESDYCESVLDTDGSTILKRTACYHRIVYPGTCDGSTPVPPANSLAQWTLLEDNCPTDCTYFRCPNDNFVYFKFDYGRWFNDVLTQLIEVGSGCTLTLVSNFFGINADATNPANDAYDFATAYLQRLTFHQKSDIKRPYDSNPSLSTVWNLKLKDLLDDLRVMFNVYYRIETDGTFRLEHASYFTAGAGLNLTARAIKNTYDNDYSDQPNEEKYFYVDEKCSTAFESLHIQYDCGDEPRDYRLKLFSCDIAFITNFYNKEVINDAGFVLICTEEAGGVNYIQDDNLPLSWQYLHDNLHRHWKAAENLIINGFPGTAATWRRQKKSPAIITRLCCEDTYDPADEITTDIGTGQVESAEINVLREHITLKLKY